MLLKGKSTQVKLSGTVRWFQVEGALIYLVVSLTFAHDGTLDFNSFFCPPGLVMTLSAGGAVWSADGGLLP